MHSRKRGTSRSHKPLVPMKPSWLRYGDKEVELLVTKLAKEGKRAAEIGLALRDTYGIPSVRMLTQKRVSHILVEKKLTSPFPDDLMNLMRHSVRIRKHLEKNKHDETAKRGLLLTESKILRLAKYYKAHKKIDQNWKYSPEEIALVVTA